MVQNQPGWDASYTVGLSKQMKVKLYLCELLCFKCRTVLDVTHYGDFVRRDQIVQKGIKHDTEKQAISEFLCASASKRVSVGNHSYDNDFDLHENETAGGTHSHIKGFALRHVLKQRHKRTRSRRIKIVITQHLTVCGMARRYRSCEQTYPPLPEGYW